MCLAIPGQVLSITGEGHFLTGKVSFGGIEKEISLACVPEVQVGRYVLVHVGFAIGIVDDDEAKRVFEHLEEIGELEELEGGEE